MQRWGRRSGDGAAGAPLAVGAFLDGIPEQAVLGIGIAAGGGVSAALLVAIYTSPRRSVPRPTCAGPADAVSSGTQAFVDGFAAGALLTMLIDSMVPEAKDKAKDWAGLATVAGFALAAGLWLLGQ